LYFVVKVSSGQERIAANMLTNKSKKEDLPIYSIIVIEGMKGYIIVEAEDEPAIRTFITRDKNIKGVLNKPLTADEVDKLVAVKSLAMEIGKNDLVEFTSGPFKGYKAKVLKVDDIKGDITVELMDVVVPIPITTKMNTAKVLQKAPKVEQ
jgi:transcription termination/antitermination protein NusG